MARYNPGPFEPVIYFLQTPAAFRIVGIGGLALFTVLFLYQAGLRGERHVVMGLILLAAIWLESSVSACRRCQHYGTWHCAGQGMLVSLVMSPLRGVTSEARAVLHFGFAAVYVLYGLFWLWHSPLLGFLFTLWVPGAVIAATPVNGFSWRARDATRATSAAAHSL